MKKEERLFAALGGVDPALLERSEKKVKRKHIWLPVGLAAAACAAIVLAAAPLKAEQAPLPVAPEPAPEDPVIDQPAPETLRLEGLEVGDLHLCQIQYGPAKTPDFVIYVNEEIYSINEEKGATVIRPKVALPETYPPIDLTITHRPGVSASLAAEQTLEELSEVYNQVFSEIATIGKGYSFTVGNGVKWDDAHATVTCAGDRQGELHSHRPVFHRGHGGPRRPLPGYGRYLPGGDQR